MTETLNLPVVPEDRRSRGPLHETSETVIVVVEGQSCVVESWPASSWPYDRPNGEPLAPGDLYVARRNGPWQLLTCQEDDTANGWIAPVEMAYVFDRNECHRFVGFA